MRQANIDSKPQNPGLTIHQLTKRYRSGTVANDSIDLEIPRGEVFGLLGPNGAGKTTLVKQIIGLLRPTDGSILLNGIDLIADPDRARQLCSYLPQGTLPIDALTLNEAIELVGRIRGGGKAQVQQRCRDLMSSLELDEWRTKKGHELSGGVRRLCGFAMAAVWPSELLILDEPTNDVDPLRRRLLWREIRRLGREGTTILLVTHNVLEAEQSVDRLAIIDEARIRAAGTPAALKSGFRDRLRLEVHSLADGAVETPGFALERTTRGHRTFFLLAHDHATAAIDWAQHESRRGAIEEYSLAGASLEDVYLQITGRGDAAGEEDIV